MPGRIADAAVRQWTRRRTISTLSSSFSPSLAGSSRGITRSTSNATSFSEYPTRNASQIASDGVGEPTGGGSSPSESPPSSSESPASSTSAQNRPLPAVPRRLRPPVESPSTPLKMGEIFTSRHKKKGNSFYIILAHNSHLNTTSCFKLNPHSSFEISPTVLSRDESS